MELLGSSAPEPFLRKAMRGSSCMRRAVNERFVLSSPLGMIFNFYPQNISFINMIKKQNFLYVMNI